jgi:hypothetical protein
MANLHEGKMAAIFDAMDNSQYLIIVIATCYGQINVSNC